MDLESSLKIFGLTSLQGQSEKTLKKRYHKLAQQYHPDKGGSTEEFIALRRAYIYLRTALHDPSFSSSNSSNEGNQNFSGDSRYQRTQNHQKSNSDTNSGNQYQQYKSDEQGSFASSPNSNNSANLYKEAYSKAVEQIRQYEEIFNAQVRIINATNKKISTEYADYTGQRNSLKSKLDAQIESLNKQYNRAWWEYIIPVPKMTRNEYITEYNGIVQTYNDTVKKVDDDFLQHLLNQYQSGFEQIIDYLK